MTLTGQRFSGFALTAALTAALAGCTLPPPASTSFADNPEPVIQGGLLPSAADMLPEPYSQGIEVVGHNAIEGRGDRCRRSRRPGRAAVLARSRRAARGGNPRCPVSFDISSFARGDAQPRLRLISSVAAAGWHSPVPATIGGQPYLANAGELGACPGAWPRITTIADETAPAIVGEFRPGDECMSRVRYAEESGTIWLACNQSGFWVIALKPEVQVELGAR